jgi:hypothetical protein
MEPSSELGGEVMHKCRRVAEEISRVEVVTCTHMVEEKISRVVVGTCTHMVVETCRLLGWWWGLVLI